MFHRVLLSASVLFIAAHLAAQVAAPSVSPATDTSSARATSETAQPSGVTLRADTQLVVLDVIVQDRSGHPIHGLKQSDFQLTEGKASQVIKTMDEHTAADISKLKIQQLPPMPPGTFTDYTPVPADGALNILLLDALNTPMKDQSYVRYQLQQYVKHAAPGTRVAIFGLNTRLYFLQGFTSDPEVLKAAVDHKLIPRASNLLDDPAGTNAGPDPLSDTLSSMGAAASTVANLQQFEAQNATFQVELRTRYTLDAFNQLARYLGTFSGRKNLLWFSGAFPLSIFPDPSLDDPFAAQADFGDELRVTTNLLARARVAVYPIDARGLQTVPVFDASNSGRGYTRNPGKFGQDIAAFNNSQAQEHLSMNEIADETGGRAFYNTNGLAEAVGKAIDSGSNYYTLTYTPSDRKWSGDYRKISLKLQGEPAARGLKLAYRTGYFADDPNERRTRTTSAILYSDKVAAPAAGTDAYSQAAMMRGAPAPSEILFKARVLPDSLATQEAVLSHNSPDPKAKPNTLYRIYDIDFAAVAQNLQWKAEADGKRTGSVQFLTYVYDSDGKLLNTDGETVEMNLKPETYAQLTRSGLKFRQQISVPAKGESFLRIAVHDVPSGRYGVIEVPISTVSRLAPPPDAVPASAAPSAPAQTQPATPTTTPPSN